MRAVLRLAAVALLVAAVSVGFAAPSYAHSMLSSVVPANNATVSPPDRVTFTFSEPARRAGTVIAVTAPDGTEVGEGQVELVDNTVSQPLRRELADGSYRVDWRVTSADGHPVSGRTSFTVSGGTAATTVPVTSAASAGVDDFRTMDTYNVRFNSGPLLLEGLAFAAVVAAVLVIRRRRRGPRLR